MSAIQLLKAASVLNKIGSEIQKNAVLHVFAF